MTQLTENVFAVEVPEGAKDIHYEVSMSGTPYIAYKFNDDELLNEYEDIVLPPGSWQFICTTRDITEKQAKGIVLKMDMGFKDVFVNYATGSFDYDTGVESLNSLLTSKGLDVNKNYVLFKKEVI